MIYIEGGAITLTCRSAPASLRRTNPTGRPSTAADPLIAVCTGVATRVAEGEEELSAPLFRHLLPSLKRTADCGFNYLIIVGYDEGNSDFDTDEKRSTVSFRLQDHQRNMQITLPTGVLAHECTDFTRRAGFQWLKRCDLTHVLLFYGRAI